MTLTKAHHAAITTRARAITRPRGPLLHLAPYGTLLQLFTGQGGGVLRWLPTPNDSSAKDWTVVK